MAIIRVFPAEYKTGENNRMGTIIPLGLHRVGFDPAVASTPLISSLSDVIGITTYFSLARLWL